MEAMPIVVNLDVMGKRNISSLAICRALDCQPGDILEFLPEKNKGGKTID